MRQILVVATFTTRHRAAVKTKDVCLGIPDRTDTGIVYASFALDMDLDAAVELAAARGVVRGARL